MNANNEDECWSYVFARLSVVALILGAIFAVVPVSYVFAPFVGLMVFTEPRVRHSIGRFRLAMPAIAFALANFACFAILTLAFFAPVKTTDDYLRRTMSLPKTKMTLGELSGFEEPPHMLLHLRGVSVSVPQDEIDVVIEFSATELTMRQFVDAVERQSTLRHRFGHCGNGSTILWGGDCSFGLHLRRPRQY
ncbi:hypothetical protein LOC67_17010 [Stieleria sp. JC731]|uniref:hypothetical protein n=1 Tax=Pirellulaceae TaxID=2691357 RepID=UPI001E3FE38A|nr:hypothetical protein [Stieleria sp. JC731]MCC9602258.1 hypothetical protein [Stieleria sp. JC731]